MVQQAWLVTIVWALSAHPDPLMTVLMVYSRQSVAVPMLASMVSAACRQVRAAVNILVLVALVLAVAVYRQASVALVVACKRAFVLPALYR